VLKAPTYDISQSNIALLGSDLEKKVKAAAADKEPAWDNAGKAVGLEIWRIEKFKVVAWPKEQYGQFYSGDSYIVLNTYQLPGKPALLWNVHFWLGAHTTQDEAGTAAYKTVELDDKLGGAPVQYREVQGHESGAFLALFANGITLLEGGVDSGFKAVKAEEYKPRLLHIKGTKKSVTAVQVPLAGDSFNSGDCFLLDLGMDLWVWQGASAGIFEKNKAASIARALDDERAGKPQVHVVSEGDDAGFPWDVVGGKPAQIAAATPDDVPHGRPLTLFKVSDSAGALEMTKVAEGEAVEKSQLDTNDAFILDANHTIFVWVGLKASADEKKHALGYAQSYLHNNKLPEWTCISRIFEGGENEAFEIEFQKGVSAGSRNNSTRVTSIRK
jgi:gelsolin